MRTIRDVVVIAAAVAICCLTGQAQQKPAADLEKLPFAPRRAICYRTTTSVQIDGKLDEPAWRATAWSDPFIDIEGHRKPSLLTRMKMLWDDEFFYVGADLEEPHLWATLSERDSVIFQDNDFEVFIDPDADTHAYYELEINALNTVWDLMLIQPYRDGGPAIHAWDIAGLRTAVDLRGTLNRPDDTDSGWSLEIAIPWKILREGTRSPSPPRAGDQWRVNFSRVQWQLDIRDGAYAKRLDQQTGKPLPEDNWVWSPQGAINMHMPERWGIVQFADAAAGTTPTPFVENRNDRITWALRRLYYRQRDFRAAHGRYASDLSQLGADTIQVDGIAFAPSAQVTDSLYEIRANGFDGAVARIRQDGRVTVSASKTTAGQSPSSRASTVVRPGIEVFISDLPQRLRGKRVGLITNHTGIDRSGTSDIDLIARHNDLKLVALLAPEHGIRGTAEAGQKVLDETDPRTGVPVVSLYMAEDRGPTPEMLKDVDVLVYDLQEVGGRTWTYVSTMALSMQAAVKKGIPFVVLDRPNPIGGDIVEGALLDPKFKSFVGMYPIPARHGMTVGELATLFNQKYGILADLIVVRTENWRRAQWFDQTGLPWVNPSPNLRSLAALTSYPGSVYFEGTNLTEGRGTDRPFEQIGAAWLNAPDVVRVMNVRRLPGIRFEAITMPVSETAAKFKGQTIPAIRFVITDRQAYRPVRTALLLIEEIRRQHPRDFAWGPTIDRLTGSDKVRRAIDEGQLPSLLEEWDREAAAFKESRRAFLLYQ